MSEKEVLTIKQTAQYLNLSIATLYRIFDAGALPRCKVSAKRVGVLKTDLDAYLKSNKI